MKILRFSVRNLCGSSLSADLFEVNIKNGIVSRRLWLFSLNVIAQGTLIFMIIVINFIVGRLCRRRHQQIGFLCRREVLEAVGSSRSGCEMQVSRRLLCCCVVVLWQAIEAVIKRIYCGLGFGWCWRWCFSVGCLCFKRHAFKALRAFGLSIDIILIIIMIK